MRYGYEVQDYVRDGMGGDRGMDQLVEWDEWHAVCGLNEQEWKVE